MTPTPDPALELRGLSVSLQARPVLDEVSATFPTGRVSGIVGPNGAGKSTLLRASLGLVPRSSGEVLVLGAPVGRVCRDVAYVPQRDGLDWDFPITVSEVVAMGRYAAIGWFRRIGRADRAAVAHSLDRVGLDGLGPRPIGQLSGGQRQRVLFARALAQEAPLLLLDEPFAAVDARTEAALLEVLRAQCRQGGSAVVVHHDLRTARSEFDWALLLGSGIARCGHPEDVLTPALVVEAYAGPTAGAPGTGAPASTGALAWAG